MIARALAAARGRAPWIALALLVGILACTPDEVPGRLYRESFEDLCEGVPCGWQRTNGTADQATWVETIHPGEHGLRLTGEVSVRGEGTVAGDPVPLPSIFVQAAARCDAGSSLRVDLVLADEVGNEAVGSAFLTPDGEWSAPFVATPSFTVTPPTSDLVTRVVAIGIAKSGGGTCEISDLAVDWLVTGPGC